LNNPLRALIRIGPVLAIAALLAVSSPASAQIRVITSGGFAAVLRELLPDFEKATGIAVTTLRGPSQGDGPDTIGAQLRRGVPADVVIMAREGLDPLIAEGRIASLTDVDLARTPLGVAVRAGSPRPDIGTVDAFKQALLRARVVSFPSSTTGIYMTGKLFPRLGIARELLAKIRDSGVEALASGESEIAVQPVSELLHMPGIDFVGPVPDEIQYNSVFSAAIVAGSKQPESAGRLIVFLASAGSAAAIHGHGMEPARSR
jgi:molybdate transport system substrate-binding protein